MFIESPHNRPLRALKELMDGNGRFLNGESRLSHEVHEAKRHYSAAYGQKPFATVLTCSDSRIPVETIFDQSIGDLFVVRIAGNVATEEVIASLEFSITYLESAMLLVLGHTQCGAVAAVAHNLHAKGSLATLFKRLQIPVTQAKKRHPNVQEGEGLTSAITENVWYTLSCILKESNSIKTALLEKQIMLQGALYAIDTGQVEFLGSHPKEPFYLENELADCCGSLQESVC